MVNQAQPNQSGHRGNDGQDNPTSKGAVSGQPEPCRPQGAARSDPKGSRSHLTVQEVAERWGVSANFVWSLVWDGKLARTRFGRAIRVPPEAVECFAQENTRGTES
jgi:excisionase family DNA binding protein